MLTNYKQFYKRLWYLDLPSKVKITSWRISCNFLPTFNNLHYRRLAGFANCPRCQNEAEMSEHVFRDCLITKEIWEKLHVTWPIAVANTEYGE
ncbi:hypothetical protein CXB51_010544 [Gossypium anomalum]|uniref:Reverse transcriptase zinc-binding domain-containing protein n=1 Tax=Gossypium anomalum TaxID=47600 RepID=A0A8J5Z330_9ROSI|nr:hypothetical protein CXB51_010544 [Gossypium anomalum]